MSPETVWSHQLKLKRLNWRFRLVGSFPQQFRKFLRVFSNNSAIIPQISQNFPQQFRRFLKKIPQQFRRFLKVFRSDSADLISIPQQFNNNSAVSSCNNSADFSEFSVGNQSWLASKNFVSWQNSTPMPEPPTEQSRKTDSINICRCVKPGTDVMILKIFSPKKLRKNWLFDSRQSYITYAKFWS
jgi:hypothetical protein